MNSPSIENEIKDFYQEIELPADAVESILDSGYYACMANRWQRVAIASMIGLAAMTILSLSLFLSKSSGDLELANAFPKEKLQATPALLEKNRAKNSNPQLKTVDKQKSTEKQFRLVAVRSHGHACPHCRETKEVFDQLEEEMKEAPLQFADLQLSEPTSSEKVEQLNIQPLVAGRAETAFIALTTMDGTKVREFKPSMGLKRIRKTVQQIITQ